MWESLLSHPEWEAMNLNIDRGRTGFYLEFSMAEVANHTVELIKEDLLDLMENDDSPYGKFIAFDDDGDQFSVSAKLKVPVEVFAAHIREPMTRAEMEAA